MHDLTVILDPGSTHCGDKDTALKMIHDTKRCGADAIKFQLFPKAMASGGNVFTPPEWMPDLVQCGEALGIEVFASVFDVESVYAAVNAGCRWVKLAYSKAQDLQLLLAIQDAQEFETVIVSGDVMTPWETLEQYMENKWTLVKLFCIPRYPVYEALDIPSIENTNLFHGFSDHTLGTEELGLYVKSKTSPGMSETAPWVYWEKHVRPDNIKYPTPDGRFAVTFNEIKEALSCEY